MAELILTLNPGSSSRKYGVYDGTHPILAAHYEEGPEGCKVTVKSGTHHEAFILSDVEYSESLAHFIARCEQDFAIDPKNIKAVGLRVVAPGRRFLQHQEIDDEFIHYLESIASKAPLHISTELGQIQQAADVIGHAKCYAISDSAFHSTFSHYARNYAINRTDADAFDIYRYGYHGLSASSILHQLQENRQQHDKVIVCHLGGGSSITAINNGVSVDNSMGYSPLEGLIMATRSGSIDIEAALELKRKHNFDDQELIEYLNVRSGLLGLSEQSADLRVLIDQSDKNEAAAFAINAMVYRIQTYIGAYVAALNGLDALVFTGTIGERSALIRAKVCKGISALGVQIDDALNEQHVSDLLSIAVADSSVKVYATPSQEDAEIARQTYQMLH